MGFHSDPPILTNQNYTTYYPLAQETRDSKDFSNDTAQIPHLTIVLLSPQKSKDRSPPDQTSIAQPSNSQAF